MSVPWLCTVCKEAPPQVWCDKKALCRKCAEPIFIPQCFWQDFSNCKINKYALCRLDYRQHCQYFIPPDAEPDSNFWRNAYYELLGIYYNANLKPEIYQSFPGIHWYSKYFEQVNHLSNQKHDDRFHERYKAHKHAIASTAPELMFSHIPNTPCPHKKKRTKRKPLIHGFTMGED